MLPAGGRVAGWTVAWLTSHVSYAPTLALVDVDGDGATDVLFPDTSARRVGWLPAPPGVLVEVGPSEAPVDLDAADLDGDGDLDLAVTAADGLWWFEQTTPGAFAPQLVAPATTPQGAAVGDLDGDGLLDLALADATGLALWLGTGAGFAPGAIVDFTACASPVAADLDGDGLLDLVVARSGAQWYRALGGGAFAAAVDLGPGATTVVPADLDGDGDLDVAWSGFGVPVRWAENVGGGTFRNAVALTTGNTDGLGAVAAAELDGVPGDELVAAVARRAAGPYGPTFVDRRVQVLSWATGSAAAADVWDLDARTLAAGDVDGDGLGDLVAFQPTTTTQEPAVLVRSADGAGGWDPPVEWTDAVVTYAAGLGELDGDGLLDVATVSVTSRRGVRTFPGVGPGAFGRSVDQGLVRDVSGTFAVLDPEGDGVDELLVAGQLYSVAGGALSTPTAVSGTFSAVGDVDLDGDPDAVDCGTADVHRYGGGAWTTTPAATPATSSSGCRLLDLTGDGAPELVTWWLLDVYVRTNAGDGTFSAAATLPFAVDVIDLDAGDLDGDGDVDLVMADFNRAWLALGDAGTFPAATVLPGGPAEGVRVLDLDLDGDADVATIGSLGKLNVSLQAGGALGAPTQVLDLRGQAWFTDAGDVDGDGDDDLLFAYNQLRGSGILVNPTREPAPPPPPLETADTGLAPAAHTGHPVPPPETGHTGAPPVDDTAGKPEEGGCGCAPAGRAGAGAWLGTAALAALLTRRGAWRRAGGAGPA